MKKPVLTDGFFASQPGMYCRMAAPLYPACGNYPAYEAGAIVEPISVSATRQNPPNRYR
ncbi:TPA: hypothetical protein N3A33_004862 [Salmonella enterica subsp. salamae serovar 28:r:e,n,z15]|nr:hypothetical protein [Salmonella enterica subsp. salamae serovar 28:r:e,n,z15]